MRGNTVSFVSNAAVKGGLSPRVRGNHLLELVPADYRRSIPARAGEPCLAYRDKPHRPVYPRACGGTPFTVECRNGAIGLSPRVRGNLLAAPLLQAVRRSIPARAGEPQDEEGCPGEARVYPRACGGTSPCAPYRHWKQGLSPRVRGNRYRVVFRRIVTRSIPARAGEPPAGSRTWRRSTVYPRACGGTAGRKQNMA